MPGVDQSRRHPPWCRASVVVILLGVELRDSLLVFGVQFVGELVESRDEALGHLF